MSIAILRRARLRPAGRRIAPLFRGASRRDLPPDGFLCALCVLTSAFAALDLCVFRCVSVPPRQICGSSAPRRGSLPTPKKIAPATGEPDPALAISHRSLASCAPRPWQKTPQPASQSPPEPRPPHALRCPTDVQTDPSPCRNDHPRIGSPAPYQSARRRPRLA
jgi:hypothetical protein